MTARLDLHRGIRIIVVAVEIDHLLPLLEVAAAAEELEMAVAVTAGDELVVVMLETERSQQESGQVVGKPRAEAAKEAFHCSLLVAVARAPVSPTAVEQQIVDVAVDAATSEVSAVVAAEVA
jgi:hypothetical protein